MKRHQVRIVRVTRLVEQYMVNADTEDEALDAKPIAGSVLTLERDTDDIHVHYADVQRFAGK